MEHGRRLDDCFCRRQFLADGSGDKPQLYMNSNQSSAQSPEHLNLTPRGTVPAVESGYESKNSGLYSNSPVASGENRAFSRTDLDNEMFNEPEKEVVFERVESWLQEQLKG